MQMLFNSPLSSDKADSLIELLELSSDDCVIDVGCGTGEFLIRTVEQSGATAVGVDNHVASLELAKQNAAGRVEDALIQFVDQDIRKYEPSGLFDCGVCMGATHAYSMNAPAYPETLKGLGKIVRPGGKLLIGESHWTRPPDPEYLEFIGDPVGTYRTHLENVELATQSGLVPLYAITSSLEEWDDFEWRHNIRKEKQAAELEGEEAAKLLEFSRNWRMAYLRWGRGTMGFAFYLFAKPE